MTILEASDLGAMQVRETTRLVPTRMEEGLRKRAQVVTMAGQDGGASINAARPRLVMTRTSQAQREQVRALMQGAHGKSVFGDIPFSNAKFDDTLESSGQYLGLVVMLGDRVLGSCYCSLGDYFIGEGARIVSVTTFNIDPECGMGLLGGKKTSSFVCKGG